MGVARVPRIPPNSFCICDRRDINQQPIFLPPSLYILTKAMELQGETLPLSRRRLFLLWAIKMFSIPIFRCTSMHWIKFLHMPVCPSICFQGTASTSHHAKMICGKIAQSPSKRFLNCALELNYTLALQSLQAGRGRWAGGAAPAFPWACSRCWPPWQGLRG